MIQTFSDLRAHVLRLLDEAGSTGTTKTLVDDALNYAHQQRCMEFPWSFMLWPRQETITTVAGQTLYPLHHELSRLIYLYNATTKMFVREIPVRHLADAIDDEATGDTERFFWSGYSPVSAQPASASVMSLVSSSTSDSGASLKLLVKGVTAAGTVTDEWLTPNGTTTASGSISFVQILGVTRQATWTGTLTLSAGSTTLLTLGPSELGRKHSTITLLESPEAGYTLRYRFYRQPQVLSNDYDIPELPEPHSQILVWDTLIQLAAYLTDHQPHTVAVWRDLQQGAQQALYQAHAVEQHTLMADPIYIRYMGDGFYESRDLTGF